MRICTFERGVVTPQRGDEVSEQREQNEAELWVQPLTWLLLTPVQVQSQSLRERGGGGGGTLGFLSVVVLGELQQGGLQQRVEPLGGEQVLGLVQLPQAEQQSPGQNQEGRPLSETGASLLLHRLSQFIQLRANTATYCLLRSDSPAAQNSPRNMHYSSFSVYFHCFNEES